MNPPRSPRATTVHDLHTQLGDNPVDTWGRHRRFAVIATVVLSHGRRPQRGFTATGTAGWAVDLQISRSSTVSTGPNTMTSELFVIPSNNNHQ